MKGRTCLYSETNYDFKNGGLDTKLSGFLRWVFLAVELLTSDLGGGDGWGWGLKSAMGEQGRYGFIKD